MRSTIVFFVITLFLVCNLAISGNELWEKKDYGKWTLRECKTMLEDSPWAKTYTIGSWGHYEYRVQLRSALPIRMAIVRSMQIASNYDKLSSEERQKFDKGAAEYLSTSFPDRIVLHLIGGPNDDKVDGPVSLSIELLRYWQIKTTEQLRNMVFLIPANRSRIPLRQFNASQGDKCEFQFIFPRQHQGLPALGPEDKSVKLEFEYPTSPSYNSTERALIEFKTDKMLFKGKLEY